MRVIVALVAAALCAPVAAQASPPEPVSGTFVAPPPVPTDVREADGNCFAEIPLDTFTLAGSLEGTLFLSFRLHFHSPCSAIAFPAEFHAEGFFRGTVTLGGVVRSGSFAVRFDGTIDEQPLARGRLTILGATGDLAGIHGVLEFEGVPGVGGAYAGRVHFDPA